MQTVIESTPAAGAPPHRARQCLSQKTAWPETQGGIRGLLQFRSFCIPSSQPHALFAQTVMNWVFFFNAILECPLFKCQHLVRKVLQAHSTELSQKNRQIVSVTFSCALPCSLNMCIFSRLILILDVQAIIYSWENHYVLSNMLSFKENICSFNPGL